MNLLDKNYFYAMLISFILIGCNSGSEKPPESKVKEPSPSVELANWSFHANAKVRSTALLAESFIYFGDNAGNLYKLDKLTGEKVWQIKLEGEIDTSLIKHEDTLFISTGQGILYAISMVTGNEVWRTEADPIRRLEYDYFSASPLVYENTVFLPTDSGKLTGFDVFTGEKNWEVLLSEAAHSQAIIAKDNICLSSMTRLTCIDIQSETVLWNIDIDWPSSPAVSGDNIIVGSRWDYGIYSIDINTGTMQWKQDVVDWAPGKPTIYNGTVYIGSSDNHAFLALDEISGERLWRAESVANVFSRAFVNGEMIVFSSGYAYNTPGFGVVKVLDHTGETIQSVAGANFFSSPIVDNNTIYIGSDDGYFYSIDIQE